MAKNFSSREAKELIAKHRALLKTLSDIVFLESSLKLNIKNSADSLAMKEILAILRGIPIDELNGFYGGQIPTVEYLAIAMSVIENDYPTYIKMLKRLWDIVKSNPVYSSLITKKQLAMNWDGDIIQKIYDELD